MQPQNPAAWLGDIWDRINGVQNAPNNGAMAGWAVAVGFAPGDIRIYEHFRSVHWAIEECQESIRSIQLKPDFQSSLLQWVRAFQHAQQMVAESRGWHELKTGFRPELRMSLRMCAQMLDQAMPQHDSPDLDEFIKQIDSLQNEIEKSQEIDEEFRRLLLDIVETMRRAIAEYSIRGTRGVNDAFGEILGTILRQNAKWKAENTSLKTKVWNTVLAFSKIIGVVKGVAAIEQLTTNLLSQS